MNNIIKVYKEDNNYYLEYKELKCIAYLGKNGVTNNKREGDMKTPIGTFKLGISFGIHEKEKIKNNNNYIKIDDNLYWVDDINSKYYNKIIDITKIEKDFNSAEHLIEYKKQYEYAIEIKTNPNNISGKGSAIGIHCLGDKNYTGGCIAINREDMKKLLELIDNNTIIEIR